MYVLNDDVLRYSLDFFSDRDIARVALISKRLRAIAVTHRRFYISCHVVLGGLDSTHERIEHAMANRLHTEIRVSESRDKIAARAKEQAAVLDNILSQVAHLIVKLCMELTAGALENALTRSYPLLTHFSLSNMDNNTILMLPSDIFQRSTPMLKRVCLRQVDLAVEPTTAFQDVSNVDMTVKTPRFVDIACHFPSATHIKLDPFDYKMTSGIELRTPLTGQRLLHLVIEDAVKNRDIPLDLRERFSLEHIPTVTWSHVGNGRSTYPVNTRHWIGLPAVGPVSLHVGRADEFDENTPIAVSVHCAGVQRNLRLGRWVYNPLLHAERTFASRIVDLRLDVDLIFDWGVIFLSNLQVLERLHLEFKADIVSSYFSPMFTSASKRSFRFTSLRSVLLTRSLGAPPPGNTMMDGTSAEDLGRLLRLSANSPDCRPVLYVIGVHPTGNWSKAKDIFSDVIWDDSARKLDPILDLSKSWNLNRFDGQ